MLYQEAALSSGPAPFLGKSKLRNSAARACEVERRTRLRGRSVGSDDGGGQSGVILEKLSLTRAQLPPPSDLRRPTLFSSIVRSFLHCQSFLCCAVLLAHASFLQHFLSPLINSTRTFLKDSSASTAPISRRHLQSFASPLYLLPP